MDEDTQKKESTVVDSQTTAEAGKTNVERNSQIDKEQQFLTEIEKLKNQLKIVTDERDEANNTLRTMETTKSAEKKLKFDDIFGGR